MSEADDIIKEVDTACESLSLREYIDTLDEIIDNFATKREAARFDLRRQEEDAEDGDEH